MFKRVSSPDTIGARSVLKGTSRVLDRLQPNLRHAATLPQHHTSPLHTPTVYPKSRPSRSGTFTAPDLESSLHRHLCLPPRRGWPIRSRALLTSSESEPCMCVFLWGSERGIAVEASGWGSKLGIINTAAVDEDASTSFGSLVIVYTRISSWTLIVIVLSAFSIGLLCVCESKRTSRKSWLVNCIRTSKCLTHLHNIALRRRSGLVSTITKLQRLLWGKDSSALVKRDPRDPLGYLERREPRGSRRRTVDIRENMVRSCSTTRICTALTHCLTVTVANLPVESSSGSPINSTRRVKCL